MKNVLVGLCMCLTLGLSGQILPNFGGQRAGLSAMTFLKNDVSPVALSMGGATTAIGGNAYSGRTNPAALAWLDNNAFALSNLSIGGGVNQSYAAANFKLLNEAVLGFNVNSLNSGWMKERTEFQPEGTGRSFAFSTTALGASYSVRLSRFFTLGVQASYVNEIISDFVNHTVVADVGFLYTTDIKKLRFAAAIVNFGGNSSISTQAVPEDYNRTGTDVENYSAPTVFKLGVSFVPIETKKHSLLVSAEINHPNDNAENIRMGVEWNLRELLKVRAGYKLSVKGQNLPSAGLGYKYHLGNRPLWIDYSFMPSTWMGNWHQIGLSLYLPQKRENNEKR